MMAMVLFSSRKSTYAPIHYYEIELTLLDLAHTILDLDSQMNYSLLQDAAPSSWPPL